MNLKSENVLLRAIEPEDIDILYQWENDTENWQLSNTQAPFSHFVLEQYIAGAHQDIYSTKQLRLMICDKNHKAVGCIDLFDFDPANLRAGVGILIGGESDRQKGYASDALSLLIDYCFHTLHLHQIYCNITTDNEPSILLFQKFGFKITGLKKDWIRDGDKFKDELLLQRIK